MCELPLNKNNPKICDKTQKVVKLLKTNYTDRQLNTVINYFNSNMMKILTMAFLEYDRNYVPDILTITVFEGKIRKKILAWKMENVLQFFTDQTWKIRKSGTVIELGSYLTFQRKGGDCGKKQANQFQIKIIPSKIPKPLFVKIFND